MKEKRKAVTSPWWQESRTLKRDGNEWVGDKRPESALDEGGTRFPLHMIICQTFDTGEETNG